MSDRTVFAREQLEQWINDITALDLPDWNALPNLELYMDQVVLLLTRYLAPLTRGQDEKFITASIVNNYVRMKIIPPPVKKKYARSHLACLIMICVLKQSLSISSIQQLLPREQSEEEVHRTYAAFVLQMRRVSAGFIQQARSAEDFLLTEEGSSPATSAAIVANLAKSLTEYLLLPAPEYTDATDA